MNWSPETTEAAAPVESAVPAPASATEQLWERQARRSRAVPYVAALVGADVPALLDTVSVAVAASDEAQQLLDGMEVRVRTLPTGVRSRSERCVHAVLGPVLWSETMTARANSLGNDDVFVCSIVERSFDTVENRLLVAALETVARAQRVVRSGEPTLLGNLDATRVGSAAAEAARWRAHPRLADVSGRVHPRELTVLRNSHRTARMAEVLAVRTRVANPFDASEVAALADPWTRRYHEFVLDVVASVAPALGLPRRFTLSDGGLWSGPISWRHPAAEGGTPPGLCYRGLPLLPPATLYADAPWSAAVPDDGIVIDGPGALRQLGLPEPLDGELRPGAGPQAWPDEVPSDWSGEDRDAQASRSSNSSS